MKARKGRVVRDIGSRGFLVVPRFLDEAALAGLNLDFDAAEPPKDPAYAIHAAGPAAVALLAERCSEAARAVGRHTDLAVDAVAGASYFSIEGGVDFGWHQDHESYYEFQDHYHYLNFYVPIRKPDRKLSNVALVPADSLEASAPRIFQRRRGKGACRAIVSPQGNTAFLDDDDGSVDAAPFDIDRLALVPELDAGDLLLWRGDVFHKTQDTRTPRVAVSLRMLGGGGRIRLKALDVTCAVKESIVSANQDTFDFLRRRLEAAGGELSVAEYLASKRARRAG